MRFLLGGSPDQGMLIKIQYPKAGDYHIYVDGEEIPETPFDQKKGMRGELTKKKGCGENRFVGLDEYLEFYITGGCTVEIRKTEAVQLMFRIMTRESMFYSYGGLETFAESINKLVPDISKDMVRIVRVHDFGSMTNVNFFVSNKNTEVKEQQSTKALANELEKTIKTKARDFMKRVTAMSVDPETNVRRSPFSPERESYNYVPVAVAEEVSVVEEEEELDTDKMDLAFDGEIDWDAKFQEVNEQIKREQEEKRYEEMQKEKPVWQTQEEKDRQSKADQIEADRLAMLAERERAAQNQILASNETPEEKVRREQKEAAEKLRARLNKLMEKAEQKEASEEKPAENPPQQQQDQLRLQQEQEAQQRQLDMKRQQEQEAQQRQFEMQRRQESEAQQRQLEMQRKQEQDAQQRQLEMKRKQESEAQQRQLEMQRKQESEAQEMEALLQRINERKRQQEQEAQPQRMNERQREKPQETADSAQESEQDSQERPMSRLERMQMQRRMQYQQRQQRQQRSKSRSPQRNAEPDTPAVSQPTPTPAEPASSSRSRSSYQRRNTSAAERSRPTPSASTSRSRNSSSSRTSQPISSSNARSIFSSRSLRSGRR